MKSSLTRKAIVLPPHSKNLLYQMWEHRLLYLLALPLVFYFLVFAYGPMYGLLLAFKDFNYAAGIMKSPWAGSCGMEHFITLVTNSEFLNAFKNTFVISFGRLILSFQSLLS